MRKLIISSFVLLSLLTLIGCNDQEDRIMSEQSFKERQEAGVPIAKATWGKCFKSWDDTVYLLEKNDGSFLVDNDEYPATQFCTLYKQCDYMFKANCVIVKTCSRYVEPIFIEHSMNELKLIPVKCTKGIK